MTSTTARELVAQKLLAAEECRAAGVAVSSPYVDPAANGTRFGVVTISIYLEAGD